MNETEHAIHVKSCVITNLNAEKRKVAKSTMLRIFPMGSTFWHSVWKIRAPSWLSTPSLAVRLQNGEGRVEK